LSCWASEGDFQTKVAIFSNGFRSMSGTMTSDDFARYGAIREFPHGATALHFGIEGPGALEHLRLWILAVAGEGNESGRC
jgi:hypothetical protein